MSSGERKRPKRTPILSAAVLAQREAEKAQHAQQEPFGVTETAKAVLDERQVSREEREAWRRAMGNEYIYHPKGITLAQLADNERLGNVPLATVLNWSRKDNWVAKRKAYYDACARLLMQRIASEYVQTQVEELKYLVGLHERIREKLDAALAEMPLKSCEAATNSLLKLDERIDQRRQQLQAVLVQHSPPEEEREESEEPKKPAITPRLTQGEVVATAQTVLRMRCVGEIEEKAQEAPPTAEPDPVSRKKRPPPARPNGGDPTKSEL